MNKFFLYQNRFTFLNPLTAWSKWLVEAGVSDCENKLVPSLSWCHLKKDQQ